MRINPRASVQSLALSLSLVLAACSGGVPALPSSPAAGSAGSGPSSPPKPATPPAAPPGPEFAGCAVFPASSEWNRDVSADPVDAHSAAYLNFMGASWVHLMPNFGPPPWGLPVEVVPGNQALVPMSFTYAAQSDPGPYPFPPGLAVDSGPDHHAIVLDHDHCVLYETYSTQASGSGYAAVAGARYDLSSAALRPDHWSSATAAGLPLLPGLARVDEAVDRGEIRHALIFTAGGSAHLYVHPATNSTGTTTDPAAPPFGLRLRLKASYDLSGFSAPTRAILRGLQHYGMFLTDNASGQFWGVGGTQDPRWPAQVIAEMKQVPGSAFEVVQLGELRAGN